ncbi:ATP-binding protein [Streptomyces sp. NBC_00237]|uniref:ATP-binding protein n=1 Tax=Streptomyces sp. NBC_00237 TaxID=2975687 RepID=UPI00224F6539|nr:ATP-binding protein [Streptomyces sp. NBC_00237]MCX5207244.1 ATP-binding protein [Streptomyces sp. NBC_00237]
MSTVSKPWSYTLQLPHDVQSPRIARYTLRAVLEAHGLRQLRDVAELLASELLTNAHLHSDGEYALRLRSGVPGRVRISVWDTNPEIPDAFVKEPVVPDDAAECGRGLVLVRLCADSWGAYRLGGEAFGGTGKLLWAECGEAS